MVRSPISATIDYALDGVQHGFLKLPYSRDESAWGALMIPISVVKRGSGPTVLLTAGNHGDEYEGPVALIKLTSSITAEEVSGRVIILPYMNYPAFRAGRRTSPIDLGNLNRSFPGKPDGTITQKIADYIHRHLLPLADVVLDIHSGGRTLDFLPLAAVHVLDDKAQQARCQAAMRAFGAPYSMTMLELDSVGMFDTAAESMGKVFVTTELGGGGSATAKTIEIAERGVRGLLVHAGVLEGVLEGELQRRDTILLDMPDDNCFTTCLSDGLLEMRKDLGDTVVAGELLARVHDATQTGMPAVAYCASRGGVLAARHFPGLIGCGDTLAVIADILQPPL